MDVEEVFEMMDVIGEGSYGLICTCRHTLQNKIYAIKFLEIEENDEVTLQKEMDILKECNECLNTVQYFGCYLKESTLMIVMEYCEGGSVLDLMQLCHKQLTEDQIAVICAHMLKGLIYLHSHHIVHRDLKAGNVLLTRDGRAKLADFGVSAKLTKTIEKKKTIVGSPYWMAPEVITVTKDNQEGYDMKADIWSLGITAIEMAEGKPPLFEIASLRVIFLIPVRDPPTLKESSKWSSDFTGFLSTCLQKDARKRPTSTELLQHPFIQKGLKNEHLLKELTTESIPMLTKARAEKKDKKEENTEKQGVKSGTIITINTSTKKFAGEVGGGTTVINKGTRQYDEESSSSSSSESEDSDDDRYGTTKRND